MGASAVSVMARRMVLLFAASLGWKFFLEDLA